MSRGPAEFYEQPQEGAPRYDFYVKLEQLAALREKVKLARCAYRAQPTPANEIALRKLMAQDDALTWDIGFGAAPEKRK
jgi:hypothetical protein